MNKPITRRKNKLQPIPVRPDRNGELYEQLDRLCAAWELDRSKAVRRAVAEADERLKMDNGKAKTK